MKRRRIIASLVAGLMVLNMAASTVLAYDWDLRDGDIEINTTTDSQTVTQGKTQKEDSNPVISTFGESAVGKGIMITVQEDGATAKLTIDGIKDGEYLQVNSGEGVTGPVAAEVTVKGENTFQTPVAMNTGDGDGSLQITIGEKDASLDTDFVAVYSENGDAKLVIDADAEGGNIVAYGIKAAAKNAEVVIEGTKVDAWGITVTGSGDASLKSKDAELYSVGTEIKGANAEMVIEDTVVNTECIAITGSGDASLKSKDAKICSGDTTIYGANDVNVEITDSKMYTGGENARNGLVAYAGGDATVKITDSEVYAAGSSPVYIQGGDKYYGGDCKGEAKLIIDNSILESTSKSEDPAVYVGSDGFTAPGTVKLQNCELVDPEQSVAEIIKVGTDKPYVTSVVNKDGSFASAIAIKPKAQKNLTVAVNRDGSFTLKGARLSHFQNLKVNGKQLSAGDFTLAEADGVLILTFSDAFLAGLAAGEHTAEINFGKAYAIFTITK